MTTTTFFVPIDLYTTGPLYICVSEETKVRLLMQTSIQDTVHLPCSRRLLRLGLLPHLRPAAHTHQGREEVPHQAALPRPLGVIPQVSHSASLPKQSHSGSILRVSLEIKEVFLLLYLEVSQRYNCFFSTATLDRNTGTNL
jgi:hypothetical protein